MGPYVPTPKFFTISWDPRRVIYQILDRRKFTLLCLFFFVMHVILVSLCYAFSVRHFLPRGTVGCATFPFWCWFSPFVSPPPATMVACGRVLTLISLSSRLWSPSIHLSSSRFPPATLTIRGRVLAVVGLAIAPFSCRPGRHTGDTRQILTGGLPSYSVWVSLNYFLRVFPGFIARPVRGVGVGLEEPHLRFVD